MTFHPLQKHKMKLFEILIFTVVYLYNGSQWGIFQKHLLCQEKHEWFETT